jgi:hypothetical protein
LPLFLIAGKINEEILEETIKTAKEIVNEKKQDELIENRDISFLKYISELQINLNFKSVTEIAREFKEYIFEEQDEDKWINSKWVGRALKRLNLIVDKRRMSKGYEVMINYPKAKRAIRIYENEKKQDD